MADTSRKPELDRSNTMPPIAESSRVIRKATPTHLTVDTYNSAQNQKDAGKVGTG